MYLDSIGAIFFLPYVNYMHVYTCISPAEIIFGFPYEEMTFNASDVGNATMHVFGEALQSFTVNYVQGISQIEIMFFWDLLKMSQWRSTHCCYFKRCIF